MGRSMLLRDSAIQKFPKWFIVVVATVSVCSMIRAIVVRALEPDTFTGSLAHTAVLIAALWVPLALYLLYAGTTPRSTRLDLALPVEPRDLWLTHLFGVTFSALCMLIAGAGVLALQGKGIDSWYQTEGGWLVAIPGSTVPRVFAGLVLGSVMIQTFDVAVHKPQLTRRYVFFASVTLAGLFVLVVALIYAPVVFALAPVGLAVWLARRVYRRIPPVFSVVGADPHAAAALPRDRADERVGAISSTGVDVRPAGSAGAFRRHRFIARVVWEWWWILYFLLLLALGALLADVPYRWTGDADARFANISIIWYMLFVSIAPAMKRLHKVDPLPISRRTLLAHLMIPGVMCLVVAYGASESAFHLWGSTKEEIRFREAESHYYLFVPLEVCELSWGDPPANTAPWGESHEAWSTQLTRGVPLRVYSPFSTPPGSSIDFVSWQIERAVRAVYGVSIPGDEIKERYLATDEADRVVPRAGRLSIRADRAGLTPRGRGRIFPFAMLLAVVPALLLAAGYFRTFHSDHGQFARVATAVAILGVTLTIHIAVYALGIAGAASLPSWTGVVKILARHTADAVPGGVPVLWVISALLLAGGYRIAERGFERIEVPPSRRKPVH